MYTYEILVETTLSELDTRFSKHQKNIVNIINLLLSPVVDKTLTDVDDIFEFYRSHFPRNSIDVVKVECNINGKRLQQMKDRQILLVL